MMAYFAGINIHIWNIEQQMDLKRQIDEFYDQTQVPRKTDHS